MNLLAKLLLFLALGMLAYEAFAEEKVQTMVIVPIDDIKYLKCLMDVKEDFPYGYVDFNTCARCAVVEGQHLCNVNNTDIPS